MHEVGVGVAVCTPIPFRRNSRGQLVPEMITPAWHRHAMQLQLPTNTNRTDAHADGMEVGEARDKVARDLLFKATRKPEFIFFHDYDVLPSGDAAIKLLFRARHYPKIDIFAGVYCCKYMSIPDPLIYKEPGKGPFWDWTLGDLLTTEKHGIRGIHMGMTLIRLSLFRRMIDAGVVNDQIPFFKTTNEPGCRGTEDIWFCELASKINAQIMVDTSVLCGHEDRETGQVYGLPDDCLPVKRAKWAYRGSLGKSLDQYEADTHSAPCEDCDGKGWSEAAIAGELLTIRCKRCEGTGRIIVPLKLCIDLGAGENHRQWDGYVTYTLDARPVFTDGSKPDYCQDLLKMNIPNDHFDRIASSHTFEHVGRWDQETLWREVYRICKPGGDIEIIVPTVEWAAFKIAEGDVDEHVMNVLYGAQEAHGYEREYNTHYFGYTKIVAQGLAELVGFTDIKCIDWRDDISQAYNLTIRATKPAVPIQDNVLRQISEPSKNGHQVKENLETQEEVARKVAEVLRNGRTDEEIEAEQKQLETANV